MNVPPINAEPGLDPAGIFDAINFEGLKSVIVAVSGGSDSLALLYLLIALQASRRSFPELVAVTIDHGLRPESAGEARYVAGLCKEAGIPHRTLNWIGAKPDTGISAKARDVRYRLLCDAARDAGTDMILTGHTLDDQIETFVMRSARGREGGSERGLAAMAPATLLVREIWLVRPLLGISRETLREYLRGRAIAWRDDPSNENPKYERVQVRKALRDDDREQIQVEIGEKIAKRRALNAKTAQVFRHCVTVHHGICAEISMANWVEQEADVQRLAIGVLLATIGGLAFLPPAEICDKALQHLSSSVPPRRMTIARCILELKKGKALIYREMRSMPEVTVEPSETVIWDGRYRISNCSDKSLKIVACGAKGLHFLRESGLPNPHGASLQSSPALILDGRIVHVPALNDHAKLPNGISVSRHLALFDHILSGYDELLAQSAAELFQQHGYKHPPVNQINKN